MRKWRIAILLFWTAVGASAAKPALSEEMRSNWQTQRFASLRIPGHGFSIYREMGRGYGAAHSSNTTTPYGDNPIRNITSRVEIQDGQAYFFRVRPENMASTEIAGTMDGHGAHLIISMP